MKFAMCVSVPGKIREIQGSVAILTDGRKIRLGPLQGVEVGDSLEVYADIALGKLESESDGTFDADRKE